MPNEYTMRYPVVEIYLTRAAPALLIESNWVGP